MIGNPPSKRNLANVKLKFQIIIDILKELPTFSLI